MEDYIFDPGIEWYERLGFAARQVGGKWEVANKIGTPVHLFLQIYLSFNGWEVL
jgi:hypothetical protein